MVAFGLILLTSLNAFDPPMLVVIAGLVLYCWKRGTDKAKPALNDEQLIFVFKIGVVILLVMLVPGIFSSSGLLQELSVYALTLLFKWPDRSHLHAWVLHSFYLNSIEAYCAPLHRTRLVYASTNE